MGFSFNIKKSSRAGQAPPTRPKRKLNKWELDTIQPEQKKLTPLVGIPVPPPIIADHEPIPPKIKKAEPSTKLGKIFGEVGEEEIENNPFRKTNNTEGRIRNLKCRQEKVEKKIAEIMKKDPKAFAYDEVYDKMINGRKQIEDRKQRDKIIRQPKYVPSLLKHAVTRNKLHEAARERQWARKEHAIDDVYEGKEKFVTSAYKAHLSEQERLRKLEELVDSKMDTIATKGNMQSFYENMLNKRLGIKDERVKPQLAGFNVEGNEEEEKEEKVKVELNLGKAEEAPERTKQEARRPSHSPKSVEHVQIRRRREKHVIEQLKEIEKERAKKKKKKRRLLETGSNKKDALLAAKARFLARKKAKLQLAKEEKEQ